MNSFANVEATAAGAAVSHVKTKLIESVERLKRDVLLKDIDDAAYRVLPKLTDKELLMVNAGIKNLYLIHDSYDSLVGDSVKKVTVKFSFPPIKRQLTPRDVDFCFTFAGHHPRHWHVYIVIVSEDPFGKEYLDMGWFDVNVKYRYLEDGIDGTIEDIKREECNDRQVKRILWSATIGNKPYIAARAICMKLYKQYNPERPALRFFEDTLI